MTVQKLNHHQMSYPNNKEKTGNNAVSISVAEEIHRHALNSDTMKKPARIDDTVPFIEEARELLTICYY